MCWEVVAGVVPGTPIPEFTRRWVVTSETYYRIMEMPQEEYDKEFPEHKGNPLREYGQEAQAYAASLTNPNQVNWVRVDWIYY
jgi:hypothetical protein